MHLSLPPLLSAAAEQSAAQQPLALLVIGPRGRLLRRPHEEGKMDVDSAAAAASAAPAAAAVVVVDDPLVERFGEEYASFLRQGKPVPFGLVRG